jgi:hypothetical protein
MLSKYFNRLGGFLSVLLYGEIEPEERPSVVHVFPLPWRVDGYSVVDCNGVFIFEVSSATGDGSLRKALCHSIVSSVNNTGWWDYTVFQF